MPVIPAPGDPTPSAPSLRVLEDLPRRVRISDSHQTGFIAGGVLLAVTGSLYPGRAARMSRPGRGTSSAPPPLGAALRARVWDSAPCKAWLLGQPYLVAIALLASFAADGRYEAAWWALVALAVLTVGVGDRRRCSRRVASPETLLAADAPPGRASLASGVDASLIPVMAYLVGLFAWVLER